MKLKIISAICSGLVLLTRCGVFIFSPLYLDSLRPTTSVPLNISNFTDENRTDFIDTLPTKETWHQIQPMFTLVFSMGFDSLLLGLWLVATLVFTPGKITEDDRKYPKRAFVIAGAAQALSSLLFIYAFSGSRTPPYLQALLGNFHIPITFTLRFFILWKRPTIRKLACAVAIVTAEFVCLLPSIFPQMEDSKAHREEGGSSGAGRILWPLCFVGSMVPAAVSNIALERIMQDEKSDAESSQKQKVNLVYSLFFTYFSLFVTCVACFWADLIPGFGSSPNIQLFGKIFWFNLKCIFGASPVCLHPVVVPIFAWGRMITKTANVLVSALLLRYGEGANYLVIVMAMRTPILFLFWTLFDEHPFQWRPEAHLSTWLSIGALAVMIPGVLLYQTGPPEKTVKQVTSLFRQGSHQEDHQEEDERPLMQEAVQEEHNSDSDSISPDRPNIQT